MPVSYRVKRLKNDMVLLEFDIPGGVLDVTELEDAVRNAPDLPGTEGVCISGRGPVWLYAALAHKYHYTPFVATFEPRKNACVVVSTHTKEKKIGELVPVIE